MSWAKSKASIIILYVLGLSLLFGLSIWQYKRGLAKQTIEAIRQNSSSAGITSAGGNWDGLLYRDSTLRGRWLVGRSFLLENRIFQGRVGFEVLTPYQLQDDNKVLLVNRGLVETSGGLTSPEVAQDTIIQGVPYIPEKGLELGEAILPESASSKRWPKKSLYIDLSVFARVLGTDLEPVVFVLNGSDPSAYERIWKASVMSSSKHFGYAVQWLGLALTFLVYGVIWFKRREK